MIKEYRDVSLKGLNSFGIDVSAARVIEFSSNGELRELLSRDHSVLSGKWDVLGGGNNILFTKDYDGTLLHPAGKKVTITANDGHFVFLRAEAGACWSDFVLDCVNRGLWGVENLAHIPGNAGSAPVQNIGAYGAEVKDIIVSVEIFRADTFREEVLPAEYCEFGYRDSIFKNSLKGKYVITAVNFRLSKTASPNLSYDSVAEETARLGGPTLENIRQAVINIRKDKLPDPLETGNAGSFFKNPLVPRDTAEKLKALYPEAPVYSGHSRDTVKLSAGWLIDKAGWKGVREGNVGVYSKQALILVNHGGATGGEVFGFAKKIQADVKHKFGIEIETEVNIW